MMTLLDASRALTRDLPAGLLKKEHWREAGWAVFQAADTGSQADICSATEKLVEALDREGWMHRNFEETAARRLSASPTAMAELRAYVGIAPTARRPALRLIMGSHTRARGHKAMIAVEARQSRARLR